MELVVTAESRPLVIGADGLESIAQEIWLVLATELGAAPLKRGLGLDDKAVDRPLPKAQAELTVSIIDQIETWVPRVRVKQVDWVEVEGEEAGTVLVPRVRVEVVGEE